MSLDTRTVLPFTAQKHNKKLLFSTGIRLLFYFPSRNTHTLMYVGTAAYAYAFARAHTHTHTYNSWAHNAFQSEDWQHTCIQIVTWSHTAETTLAVTQTLAFAATVTVSFAGSWTRPPSLLSHKPLRTWRCCDTHTLLHSNCPFVYSYFIHGPP